MSPQQQLLSVTNTLNSNKKKERLSALESIKDLLKQTTTIEFLHENSKAQQSTLNWDIVFIRVHNAVLAFVDENNSRSRQMNDRQTQIVLDVILEVVQKSVHEQCLLINPNLVVSSILAVFESEDRRRHLGSGYLEILSKFILSHRKSWSVLKEQYWTGIKNICKTYFSSPPQGVQNFLFLELLIDTIRYSSKNCQISHSFLDLFPFLKDIYARYRTSAYNFELILLRLTNTLCLQLAVEFRYKVCEFMEDIFDFIVSFHEKQKPEKNTLVYHFLMTTLNIHNPGQWEKRTFYASNLRRWKSQIWDIFFLCWNEVKLILKNSSNMEVEMDFLILFVDVSYLFDTYNLDNEDDIEVDYSEPGPSNKRRRLEDMNDFSTKQVKLEGSLKSLLINLCGPDSWFWLRFLELLILRYPLSLKNQYCKVIRLLYWIICEKKSVQNTKMAIRCLCSFLDKDQLYTKELVVTAMQKSDDVWKKISMEVIRLLNTELSTEIHILIRSLISHSKHGDFEPLIKLYCKGTLQPDMKNFKTLSVFCQNCIVPEVLVNDKNEKVRLQLLNWLFQAKEKFPSKDLSKILIAIILKRFEEDIETSVPKDNTLIFQVNINDFCKYITRSYLTVAFKELEFAKDLKTVETTPEIRIESNVKNKLFQLLISQYETVTCALKKGTDQLSVLEDGLWLCELICHLLSLFECAKDSNNDVSFLTDMLQTTLSVIFSKSLAIIKLKLFDLSCFFKLYTSNFHPNVQMKIRESDFTNLDFLQAVFELFASRDCKGITIYSIIKSDSPFSQVINNPKSILHFENLTAEQKLIINAVEMMCQYISCDCSEMNQYQNILALKITDILNSDKQFDGDFHSHLVLRVVFNFAKSNTIIDPVLENCLDLLKGLFDSRRLDFEVLITGLQNLKDLMPHIRKSEDEVIKSKFKKIIHDLSELIVTKRACGVKAITKFIECLSEISKTDINEQSEEIITFLQHPYHEVRLTAAQHVGLLFVFKKSATIRQNEMLKNLFRVLTSLNDEEHKIMSTISLISCASVICLSSYWRKKALFWLIYLAFQKKFKNDDVTAVVTLICKELRVPSVEAYILSNFEYLLRKWAKKGLGIENFPFYLLEYKIFNQFALDYFPDIVAVYSEIGELDIINVLSLKINKPVNVLMKICHPQLLAFILPSLNENVVSERVKKAQKLKSFIDQEVGSQVSLRWLTESLDKVIFNMIRNMHDPPFLLSLCEFSGNLKDDKNPLGYNAIQIEQTLENLGTGKGKPLLGKLAEEIPSMIEKIFISLLGDVEKAVIFEQQVFAFYKYIFFVEMIVKVTSKDLIYRKINMFVIREVVYTSAAILRKNENEILVSMAVKCFRKLTDYVSQFSDILGEFLPAITTALTPVIIKGNKNALEVVRSLICGNYTKFESHISLLDFFPNEDIFHNINKQIEKAQGQVKSLKKAIKHFVDVGRNKNSGCRIQSLKNLREMLSRDKHELKEMYEELKMLRGFSEDCRNSLLHRLTCMLVELASDKDVTVRTEAARCLGELGPSDLTTLALKPENNFCSFESTTSMHRLLKSVVSILSDLLINDDYKVKKAASRALYAVLSTRQGKSVENVDHLTPYISKTVENFEMSVKENVFINKLNNFDLWRPVNHETWVVRFMEALLQSLTGPGDVIDAFLELIRVHWQFAEQLIPIILEFVLSLNETNYSEVINRNISEFFKEYFDRDVTTVDKTSVRCLLNVIDYVRIQQNLQEEGFVLTVNYLHVAKAALYCSAFFTSIFYAELWFEDKRMTNYQNVDINTICESHPEEGLVLAEILRECHFKIGNQDGIHGCGYMHILHPSSEIQYYEHLKNWSVSVLHHDIQLSEGNVSSKTGLLNSMERFGMLYTLNNLMKTQQETPELEAIQYKCAAKLLDWGLVSTSKRTNQSGLDSFDKCYYFALKAVHDEDFASYQNECHRARKCALYELTHCSLESSKNLYLPMTELQCLKELEEFVEVVNTPKLQNLFEKWDRQDSIKCSEFKFTESILTSRTIFIRDMLEKVEDDEMRNCLRSMLCGIYYRLTVEARKEKKFETAMRTLSYFQNIDDIPKNFEEKMIVERARVFWERGDKDVGRFLLNHFLKTSDTERELKSKALRIYGDWMAKTKSENSREIIENYYMKSIAQSTEHTNKINSYASLAKFADSLYEQLNQYLSSPLFEIKQNLINTQQDLASELRQELGWNQNREKRMAYQIAAKQSAIDENEIKNCKAERDSYLTLAIKYYLLSLKEGEKYNLVVFRVVSLWLSNSSNANVIQQLQKLLNNIPTYKFLCLLPQLVPRMADVCLISDLIEKILQDHPHHTLPLLFALSNSYEDLKYSGSKTAFSTPRVLSARSILNKFEKHEKLERMISEMRQFSDALIELANYVSPDTNRAGSSVAFPEHLQIKRIAKLSSVPVPSIQIPYNKNCKYENIIGVHEFEKTYYLVGGINVPKRITCIGSDGIGRPLLVKGRDDLRQDAVMQQVFTIMNSLLYQNVETSRRKLMIRTYKVVPLSQRSGVIEWCENTQPLSLYLTGPDGKSGAHKRFYPKDVSAFDCRMIIRKAFSQPLITNQEKLKVFLDVCKQIHPVFRYFFIEKFPAAGIWFERRLAYIHSVATSSMIGYILGIGDRHVHNILIDNSTAEVIHIDLGIAFEQGKTLPTPETVPFRLTRDIVDGMGLSGIEGDFRISCVKTMEVLRENQDTILTLLEVLLYDPLYTWTITPEKAYLIQNHTETSSTTSEKSSPDLETNKMAERALIRLKQKLQGTETGFGATNVEGQVSFLVQEARDPNNLCRIFHGWQAYL